MLSVTSEIETGYKHAQTCTLSFTHTHTIKQSKSRKMHRPCYVLAVCSQCVCEEELVSSLRIAFLLLLLLLWGLTHLLSSWAFSKPVSFSQFSSVCKRLAPSSNSPYTQASPPPLFTSIPPKCLARHVSPNDATTSCSSFFGPAGVTGGRRIQNLCFVGVSEPSGKKPLTTNHLEHTTHRGGQQISECVCFADTVTVCARAQCFARLGQPWFLRQNNAEYSSCTDLLSAFESCGHPSV